MTKQSSDTVMSLSQQLWADCEILQISGIYSLPGCEVGVQHQHSHQKGPAEDELPAPAQEVQPASGANDPVLRCSH